MKVYIETLGCKVNQYESSCIVDEFIQNGYEPTDDMAKADVIIINTCTVTNRTDYKSRHLINQAIKHKQQNPNTKIIVTGCYSQREIQDKGFEGWEMIDLIVDNNSKELVNAQWKAERGKLFGNSDTFTLYSEMKMNKMHSRSRAFLKIQDGCDYNCSYCAVPSARGRSRCRSVENIFEQTELLLNNGHEEIVLGGINLGLFKDLDKLLFKFNSYDKLKRIRLSSIEPQLFTPNLLHAIKEINKVCPHFHIPLQSGSDEILKLHGRGYNTSEFESLINKLRDIMPYCALGFDVIVGLPGETDELFEQTYNLLKKIDFTYLHVFIYSKRRGTPSAKMKNQVHGTVAKERSKLLLSLSDEKKIKYIHNLIVNKIDLNVSVEQHGKDGLISGTSDRYIAAYFKELHHPLKPIRPHLDGVYCDNS